MLRSSHIRTELADVPRPRLRALTASDVIAALRHHGLLLKSDPKFPSVTTIIAGEPVRGSWWAHPEGHRIFRVLEDLTTHRDVLLVKLIAGKDTFVHRRLWPEIAAIATSCAAWQWRGVSKAARQLFAEVEKAAEIETTGDAPLELESRLLVHGEQFHTEGGSHAKRIESWTRWTARAGVDPHAVSSAEACRTLEEILPRASWPWRRKPSRK